jgi:hypothetical protein
MKVGNGSRSCSTNISSSRCARSRVILQVYLRYTRLRSGKFRNGRTSLSQTEGVRRYTDYFQYLYRTIEMRLKGELANQWGDAKIEFIFSVPTTWKPIPTVERFRKIISLSGFGSFPSHSVAIGLTEAEAAAVDTARTMPGIFKVRRR